MLFEGTAHPPLWCEVLQVPVQMRWQPQRRTCSHDSKNYRGVAQAGEPARRLAGLVENRLPSGLLGERGDPVPGERGAALPRPWLYSREGSCRWVLVEGWVRCCCAVGRAPKAGRPELLSRAACRTPRLTDKAQAAAGQERARIRRWCQVIACFRVTRTAWCHACPPLTLLHSSQVRGQALAGSKDFTPYKMLCSV